MSVSQQFRYWNLSRKGSSQVDIANKFGVSRQAVSKAIKAQEHKVLISMMELAKTIGALIEWHSYRLGLLIGQIPQLHNNPCIILVTTHDDLQVYYSQSSVSQQLISLLKDLFGLDASLMSFQEIINAIVKL